MLQKTQIQLLSYELNAVNACISGSETSQHHNVDPWFTPKNDENRVTRLYSPGFFLGPRWSRSGDDST
jgi:hypothetical protein